MKLKSIKKNPRIIVILGPTATGKSDLAIKLAKKYNGEVISADSRQVYKGLDIGTGKITKKEMRGVPHYLLDVVSPKRAFTIVEWKKEAEKSIRDIISRDKLPIICGGTGFYIQSILDGIILPEVPPNRLLRKKLGNKNLEELQKILAKLDPRRFSNIDIKNPVRLIRAIEIATELGKVPTLRQAQGKNFYKFLQIGLRLPDKDLKKKIHNRLISRMKNGMVKEAENLHKQGISWKRMRELGLEYRYVAEFLQNKSRSEGEEDTEHTSANVITKEEFNKKLETEIWHYAKRQIVWFKRDQKIKWFKPNQMTKVEKEVETFLRKT